MAWYQILSWQDIPSQIKAWDDFDEIKVELDPRFAARIDQAAQTQGLTQTDAYLGQWKWSDEAERGGTPEEVAHAVKHELEAQFSMKRHRGRANLQVCPTNVGFMGAKHAVGFSGSSLIVAQVAQPAVSPTASRQRGRVLGGREWPSARGLATRETADSAVCAARTIFRPPIPKHLPFVSRRFTPAGHYFLDYSPDGSLIAVAGFHGSAPPGGRFRLGGEAHWPFRAAPDRAVLARWKTPRRRRWSPGAMGKCRSGTWKSESSSFPSRFGYDTVYGANWSPDGTLFSFGCPDNTVRAVEAAKKRRAFSLKGSHNDWVLDTVFSTNGSHIVSSGRDMSAKLTETATQRFVDNITSITPDEPCEVSHSCQSRGSALFL